LRVVSLTPARSDKGKCTQERVGMQVVKKSLPAGTLWCPPMRLPPPNAGYAPRSCPRREAPLSAQCLLMWFHGRTGCLSIKARATHASLHNLRFLSLIRCVHQGTLQSLNLRNSVHPQAFISPTFTRVQWRRGQHWISSAMRDPQGVGIVVLMLTPRPPHHVRGRHRHTERIFLHIPRGNTLDISH
jgi:hypothetical protein